MAVDKVINFEVGQKEYPVEIEILDDATKPMLEGPESFNLVFEEPQNAVVEMPEEAKVIINDEEFDGKRRKQNE